MANCGLLWEWSGQLENIKGVVDWALVHVIEGLEAFGPSTKADSKPIGFILEPPKFYPKGQRILSKPTKLRKKGVKLQVGKGLIQLFKPFVNKVPKLGFDTGSYILLGLC